MRPEPLKFLIIEGIDNIGKGTLIEGLIRKLGYQTVLKYEKPKKTEKQDTRSYQEQSFADGFNLMGKASELEHHVVPSMIFDRFHLGEDVYSPMYRDYDGSYVFQMEKIYLNKYPRLFNTVGVIFLRASAFELIQDDGKSFDHSAGAKEQDRFISAYQKCSLRKIIIDVHRDLDDADGFHVRTEWRYPDEILADALRFREI